jgi:hypothetical protein
MSQTRSTALGVDQATVSRDASASADVVESSAEEVDEALDERKEARKAEGAAFHAME